MTFYDKLSLVEKSLIKHCKERITDNINHMFDMWLSCEADWEFSHGYVKIFKEHFGSYITNDVESQLSFAGKNILYAIYTFISLKEDEYELEELLDFVENFISNQLEDFDHDYGATEWFYNGETSGDETTEDNPS